MPLRLLLLAVCALSGCASLPGPKLPTCDGAARRPANPYGSILPPAAVPLATADAGTPQSGGCA